MHKYLHFPKIEGPTYFNFFAQKYVNKAFLVSILRTLFLHKSLHFEKTEVTPFKYANSFSKLQPKNTQGRYS